ncbi:MAG: 50S ribosomal protein L10 [bacterium]|nr:50S ribosomal protein L10 [bacterium]
MPKTKGQKNDVVRDLTDKLQKMKSGVFVNFSGLKMKDTQKLRELTWDKGVDYQVVKKTLLKIALKDAGLEGIDPKAMEGNLGVAFGLEDEIAAPKLLANFAKGNEALKILGGILENKFIDAAKVKALASLPSRQEMLGRLVGTIAAPVSGFLNVLQGNLRGLVQVLKAVSEKISV